MNSLCTGTTSLDWQDNPKDIDEWNASMGELPTGIKRVRLTCPSCNRRVMSSIRVDMDGGCLQHYLPPHKPKGWHKKPKRSKIEKRIKRK